MKKTIGLGVLIAAALLITSCATTKNDAKEAKQLEKDVNSNGVKVEAYETKIRDWTGRTIGVEAKPAWLAPALGNNFRAFITANGLSGESSEYRLAVFDAGAADVRGAEMRVEMAYARKIAKELQQRINTWAAQSTNSGALDAKTRDAISERTQTQSSAETTGHQQVYQFWQIVETEDGSGKKETHTLIWQVYHVNPKTWAKTIAKYIKEVIGSLPEEITLEENQVNDMLTNMMNDARHPIELTQEQQKNALAAEKKMLELEAKSKEKDIDLKDEKLENEKLIALAEISQNAQTDRTKIKSDAQTAQVKTVADARAVAYASGDPVAQRAASVTADDADWINAMSLAQNILGY